MHPVFYRALRRRRGLPGGAPVKDLKGCFKSPCHVAGFSPSYMVFLQAIAFLSGRCSDRTGILCCVKARYYSGSLYLCATVHDHLQNGLLTLANLRGCSRGFLCQLSQFAGSGSRTTPPGSAPVGAPFAHTAWPATKTLSTPAG